MGQIRVRLAQNSEDREKIFQLRYDIYVQEMNRKQSFADHEKARIHEPYDDTGHLFLAEDDDQVIGTVRINFRKDGELECENLYDMGHFQPFYPNQVSMSTKLMVRREYRSSAAASMLCMKIYEHARENGILIDFIDTNPHLVRLYSQVGYRLYKKNIDHPDYGNVIPMVFLLDDHEYLRQIHSPFLRLAKRYPAGTELADLFKERFPDYRDIRPLFSMEGEEVWSNIVTDMALPPNQALSFLFNFTEQEASKLLSMLDLIVYEPGAVVFKQNQESQGLFCVLEGAVSVLVQKEDGSYSTIAVLNQGEIFGELGFVAKTQRNATIVVRDKAKLLILTPNEFQKLELQSPSLAMKLLTNLFVILGQRFNEMSRRMLDYRRLYEMGGVET
ncbi:GNAT family N-acetyltransferase [Leptospira ilyithenensis]|uniref:GNAT family N-acetyltransferase n=1 Tax=Leptospira ilyithenensis TaxID=2484901 RepID=A0A4R9LR51_9LEPT|nr:GNAT family N-acetyltransferase [Leptospira ilyithenensis]TGN13152.1 GNAT family N-acetyltransferase [Leptospira ilyithenensis]